MKEIELKFQIPEGMLPAVRQAVAERQVNAHGQGHAIQLSMHAAYLDTPDRALARRRCALRVRQEGELRVQTFKGAGGDAMTRLEENRPAPAAALFDLSLHGPAVQTALQEALPHWQIEADPTGLHTGLTPLYETRFERSQAELTLPQGQVLLCLDQGLISAGELRQPMAELEFELLGGSPLAVLDAARRWSGLFGLWLDVQSKALKGTRLAQEAATGQAVEACAPEPAPDWIDAGSGLQDEAARRAWLSTLLDLCAGPASDIAQLTPGWPHALQAWSRTLDRLAQARAAHATLPCAWLATTRVLSAKVADLAVRVAGTDTPLEPSAPLSLAARTLATQAATTLWMLDLLALIHAEAQG